MTTANKITLVRIALIPVFMVLASLEQSWAPWAAFCVFAVAGLTDGLDGHIARKYNQVSAFGKFVDPLADKLLVAAALVGYICIKTMLVVVRNKKFKYFAFYCFAIGIISIVGHFVL